jgi:tripartite-type tricarboxylate transporter receptor subunit TctC
LDEVNDTSIPQDSTPGSSAATHDETFKMMTGVTMLHVPYRGEAPALTDLLGGQVQVYFGGMAGTITYVRADKLQALAVSTATSLEALPGVPTVGELLGGQ